jgi:hypothetical protein
MVDFIGKHYCSPQGHEELSSLRINQVPDITTGAAPIELLARVPSEECGCPEELWRINGIDLMLHFEDDGTSDLFIFAGDFELENSVTARSLDDLRAKAFQWFADVMDTPEQDCRNQTS